MTKQEKFWKDLSLDRASAVTLSAQLADAVREAVDDGLYRAGDTLPSQLELAKILGTSARVPREAFAELAAQRVAVTRPRLGCVILPRRTAAKRGRVVFIVRESIAVSHYVTVFENALRGKLVRAGFTFVKVVLTSEHGVRGEYVELEDALSHPNVLFVVFDDELETFERIRSAGAPVASVGILSHISDSIRLDVSGALPDFVAHCRRAHVKSVTQFSFGTWIDATARLREAGIRVDRVVLDPLPAKSVQEGIQRAGMKAVFARYGKASRRKLPDVLLFTDDYLASGALLALSHLGIRAPEDVRIAVFASAGNGPVYPVELTRMEMDPAADSVRVAEWLKPVLAGRPLPPDAVLRPRYLRAASFP